MKPGWHSHGFGGQEETVCDCGKHKCEAETVKAWSYAMTQRIKAKKNPLRLRDSA